MPEPLRRVKIEAEVDEETAASLERAIAAGDVANAGELIETAVWEWEEAQWRRENPEAWQADVDELHRRLDGLDADPSLGIPLEESRARLLARFAVPLGAAE